MTLKFNFIKNQSSENSFNQQYSIGKTWKIMIINEDLDIHKKITLTLENLVFKNKKITYINAYSYKEAKELLYQHHDIAIVLLGIQTNNELKGLEIIEYLRKKLNNLSARIILIVNYLDLISEKDIVYNYDINGFCKNSNLTTYKFYSIVISSLRSYQNIVTIESHKKELLKKTDDLKITLKHLQLEILERKRIEISLIQSKKQAERKSYYKDILLSKIDFLIRNPLTKLNEKYHSSDLIASILKSLDYIQELNLLEEKSTRLNLQSIEIISITQEAIQLLQKDYQNLDVKVSFIKKHQELWSNIHNESFKQIIKYIFESILSLIDNENKLIELEFDISNKSLKEMCIIYFRHKHKINSLNNIIKYNHDAFFQEDEEINYSYILTGLKLSIAELLVQNMGGYIIFKKEGNIDIVEICFPYLKKAN